MKTAWDYSALAKAYLRRPSYAEGAVDAMLAITGAHGGASCCDVGAGAAHLTLMLARRGLRVVAVEPNDAMRAIGMRRTESIENVVWHEGTAEATGQAALAFGLVTFGSSFNVCDRPRALAEAARILHPGGWFACMWNHRDLSDPIQAGIERVIAERINGYSYGSRREDQTSIIGSSRAFGPVVRLSVNVIHEQSVDDCVEAWRSHATLQRQAGDLFPEVISGIEGLLRRAAGAIVRVPYQTNIWMARRH